MKKLSLLQIVALIVVFVLLGLGYIYFKEQSLLSAGKAKATSVLRSIEEGNKIEVKQQLLEFAGVSEDKIDEIDALRLAHINVDFLGTKEPGISDTFIDHYVDERANPDVYRAVFEISAEQGGSDFVVVILSKDGANWRLANIVLTATNPL